jgi:hypothetical protein
MPLDDTGFRQTVSYLEKIDWVIRILTPEARWCKGELVTSDGRQCIIGALRAVDGTGLLVPPILLAIRQVTGRAFSQIEAFNDHRSTTYAMVLAVLYKARQNIVFGVEENPAHAIFMTAALAPTPFERLRHRLGAWIRLAIKKTAAPVSDP